MMEQEQMELVNQKNLQETAQNKIRKQWENLSPMNPHGAAHYGSYAFKPLDILNSLDQGINDVTGNVLKLEGHVRNEIVYSEESDVDDKGSYFSHFDLYIKAMHDVGADSSNIMSLIENYDYND